MNLDDEERAGTRSRKYVKSKSLRFLSFIFMLLLFLFLYNLQPNQNTQTNALDKDIFELKKHFKATDDWTDYSFLTSQLTEPPKANTHQHQQQQVLNSETHSFDELRRLTNPIILSSIFTFKSTRRVPVTAVIQTVDVNQIYFQLKSVLTQTALAESIWVICKDATEKQLVMERIETLDKRRVHVMVNQKADLGWMTNTASEFIWMLDQNVVPGKRYLEYILKLTYTEEYKNTLIGTQAFQHESGCLPSHSTDIMNKPLKSQQVDMLVDNWLIYRTWIPILLEQQQQQQQQQLEEKEGEANEERWFLGLSISKSLWKAGIHTIALPTDPIERAYWGDTRVQKKTGMATTSSTCLYLEKQQQPAEQGNNNNNNNLWYKQTSGIMFFADSEQQVIELAPLYCSFFSSKEQGDIKLDFVSSTVSREMMHQHITAYCDQAKDNNKIMTLHHLDLQKEAIRQSALMHALDNHIAVTKPSVMIHTASASSISLLSQVTIISLPPEDIPHTLWMAELPLKALQRWNDFKVKIMINSNNKPHGLSRLLQSLNRAHLLNDDIELTILLDQSTDKVTQNVAESFQFKSNSNNKKKNLRHRIVPAQRAPLFAEAWYPTTDNEYAIILDNTIELSPFFYTYTKYNLLHYRYSPESSSHKQVFGISLYSPRLLETDESGRTLFEIDKKKDNESSPLANTYFMQWPSHLGALFFPEHWREFHDYMTARLADRGGYDMQSNIEIEGLRSSQWTQSWRRYFEELIYLRGYVMVYPHFDGHVGLATSHMELRTKAMREEFAQAISLFETPLMENDLINELSFDDDKVLDIWGHDKTGIEELQQIGRAYQNEISACSNKKADDDDYDPADLLCPFARIVSVTLENEKDPIPELPIRQVTIYKNAFL